MIIKRLKETCILKFLHSLTRHDLLKWLIYSSLFEGLPQIDKSSQGTKQIIYTKYLPIRYMSWNGLTEN